MNLDFRSSRPQVVNPREFEVGKRPRDEETEALIQQALEEQEQHKLAKKGPTAAVQPGQQPKKDAKTLAEIEDEEGGPVKESMVGMASTKRALSRKENESAAPVVDTEFGNVGEVQRAEEDLEVEREEGITFEPFNLKEEREEGFFDEEGNYVQQQDDARDAWLDSAEAAVVSEEVRKRLEAQRAAIAAVEASKKSLSEGEIARMKMEMVGMMEAGETVIKALKRMGATQASKKVLSKREKQKAEQQRLAGGDVPSSDEAAEAEKKRKFTRLTDLADTLLSNGELDIYTLRKEILESEAALYMPRSSLLTEGAAADEDDDMFADDDAPPQPAENPTTTHTDNPASTSQPPQPHHTPGDAPPAVVPQRTVDSGSTATAGQPQHLSAPEDPPGTSGRGTAAAAALDEPTVDYTTWPVKELRRFLQERGVDSSNIVEKAELAQKVRELAEAGPQGQATNVPDGYVFDPNSGYYYNADTGLCYDPSSGGFYESSTAKWFSWDDASQQFVEWESGSSGT